MRRNGTGQAPSIAGRGPQSPMVLSCLATVKLTLTRLQRKLRAGTTDMGLTSTFDDLGRAASLGNSR
jgi:hypothetical protein